MDDSRKFAELNAGTLMAPPRLICPARTYPGGGCAESEPGDADEAGTETTPGGEGVATGQEAPGVEDALPTDARREEEAAVGAEGDASRRPPTSLPLVLLLLLELLLGGGGGFTLLPSSIR